MPALRGTPWTRKNDAMTKNGKSWLSGVPWIAMRHDLMTSPAWLLRPISLVRLIERLQIEHLEHAGTANGQLSVSFRQFQAFGISRRMIAPTIHLGEGLGLIRVNRSTVISGPLREPHSYQLTFIPAKDAKGPSDEWRKVSEERAESLVIGFKKATKLQPKVKQSKPGERQQDRAA